MANRETGLARRSGDLVRYDPWSEIQDMRRTMDDMFSRFFGYTPMNRLMESAVPASGWNWQPNVDLYETEDEFCLRADLPGFKQDEIDIRLTADTLTINAQHAEGSESPQGQNPEGQLTQGEQGSESPKARGGGSKGDQPEAQGNEQGQPQSTAVQPSQPQHPRTYHIQNRQRQSFSVSYTLPREIDPNKAEAEYKDGVLELHLPKAEQARPKQVQVKVNSGSGK
ncbi:MAG: Hsp20/alpha crystallin family protein [Armatimonadetes bacterium]|nr:Hsp20/alpha crystallin family protein [Armatimonadota bacterium]